MKYILYILLNLIIIYHKFDLNILEHVKKKGKPRTKQRWLHHSLLLLKVSYFAHTAGTEGDSTPGINSDALSSALQWLVTMSLARG